MEYNKAKIHTKDNGKEIVNVGQVPLNSKMERNIKGNFITIYHIEQDFTLIK